jgi:hypothetical protein
MTLEIPLWICLLVVIWIITWINMEPGGDYDIGPVFSVLFGIIASLLVCVGHLMGWF